MNDLSDEEPDTFPVLVLVPDREPSGPPSRHILLGAEFLTHYGLRLVIDYAAIRYLGDTATSQRRLDPSIPCGHLEKD
jgi:hypothetical protein